jgi:hypothetical protein
MQTITDGRREVIVTDIKMPFWSMVVFMTKLAIATIPAMILLYFIGIGFYLLALLLFSAVGVLSR